MGREAQVVGSAQRDVGEELEVADAVGAQLEVAGRHAVLGLPAEGTQVGGLDGAGESEGFFGGYGWLFGVLQRVPMLCSVEIPRDNSIRATAGGYPRFCYLHAIAQTVVHEVHSFCLRRATQELEVFFSRILSASEGECNRWVWRAEEVC